MTELIAQRQFAPLYIWLDIAFLAVLAAGRRDFPWAAYGAPAGTAAAGKQAY